MLFTRGWIVLRGSGIDGGLHSVGNLAVCVSKGSVSGVGFSLGGVLCLGC